MTNKTALEQHMDKLAAAANELNELEALMVLYPDLKLHTNRWGNTRYTSSHANPLCTKYDLAHNCGCCDDSPLELWPYTEANGVRIYAEGIPFRIGARWPNGGEDPYTGWENELRRAKIPEDIIAEIAKYFAKHPPNTNSDEDALEEEP